MLEAAGGDRRLAASPPEQSSEAHWQDPITGIRTDLTVTMLPAQSPTATMRRLMLRGRITAVCDIDTATAIGCADRLKR